MNELEKNKILALRRKGASYGAIAQRLGLSVNTVKSCCRRNDSNALPDENMLIDEAGQSACKHCGKLIHSIPGKRKRIFCSDACRYAHAYETGRGLDHTAVCSSCGMTFSYSGQTERKYCGRACYFTDRFQGGFANDK